MSAKGILWSPPVPPGVNASLYGGESHMVVIWTGQSPVAR